MARQLRIEYPSALYHIVSRGNAHQNTFLSESDYITFFKVLNDVCDQYVFIVYAYCLMSNHYHLLIETIDANLSAGMRQLNGVYTQKFNYFHQRVGHLFQGRYKAIIVEKDSYLMELSRYIVLNPVRAGIAKSPQEWKWSSYRAMIGMGPGAACLDKEWLVNNFGSQKTAREKYISFVNDGLDRPNLMEKVKKGMFLGSDEFIAGMKDITGNKKEEKEIPKKSRFIGRPSLHEIFTPKGIVNIDNNKMYQSHVKFGYGLKDISDFLNIHYSTVSKAILRYKKGTKEYHKSSKIKT